MKKLISSLFLGLFTLGVSFQAYSNWDCIVGGKNCKTSTMVEEWCFCHEWIEGKDCKGQINLTMGYIMYFCDINGKPMMQ
jgi:hypothetical protein